MKRIHTKCTTRVAPRMAFRNPIRIPFLLALLLLTLAGQTSQAQTVEAWLTKGDQSVKLQQQASTAFSSNPGSGTVITVNEATTYQTVDGFGFALTQGSAEALYMLNASTRSSLLQELFSPSNNGISLVRISIAASDLSNSSYSYNEVAGDVNMNNFSLAGPDQTYLIPMLQEILAINPSIEVLATPWSAPRWMKTNGSWIGGRLQTQYYQAYANYFVAYLNAMAAQGIPIWAITPQNEPENPWNEPSMEMNSTEQKNFINNHLGPAIASSGHSTKIIAFDHNCDNTAYPIDVLNNSPYVDGAAFHLYGGDISAMSTVRNATGKNVYFTEQYTDKNGNFGGDLGWHMQNVVIGSLRNWSKTVFEWNLATDSNYGPRTPGGCTHCLGAITVQGSNSFSREVSYYIISQISKFVQAGATRIASSESSSLHTVAFKNPNGSYALLVYNSGSSQAIKVEAGGEAFVYTVPGSSAMTFSWQGSGPPPPSNLSPYNRVEAEDYDNMSGVQLEGSSDAGGGQNVGWADDGDWIMFENVDFGSGASTLDARIASNANFTGTIEVRLGSTGGTLAGTVSVGNTGGWQSWATRSITLSNASGVHNVYFVFKGGGGVGNLNWWQCTQAPPPNNFSLRIEAEDYTYQQGTQTESCSEGGQNVGYLDNGDWLSFQNINIPQTDTYTISYRVASPWNSGSFNLDANGGANYYGTLNINATGGWQSWSTISHTVTLQAGVQELNISVNNGGFNLNWFEIKGAGAQANALTHHDPFVSNHSTLTIYPNPSKNAVTVSGLAAGDQVQVFSLDGREQLPAQLASTETLRLNVATLPMGVYLIKVSGATSTQTLRLVKE